MTPRQVQILIGLGVLIAVLLVVLVAVLVIGGGDETAAPTSLPTTTSTSEPTSTTSTSSSTTSSTSPTTSSTTSTSTTTTTTTTLPPGACAGPGAGPLPVGATVAVEVMGDFDGDGADDRFLVYEDSGGTYWARMELSYGYAAVAPDPTPGPGVINAKSVDLGGPGELAIAESIASPSSRLATFYALYDCGLDAVRQSDGPLAQFPLRGSGLELAGITCRADGISVTRAASTDGTVWEVSTLDYSWDPVVGELVSSMGAAAILHSPEDDAAILSQADWNC